MKTAHYQFTKGSTTIVQSKFESEPEPPVFIVCPDPPFKTSFFQDHGSTENWYPGISAHFWESNGTKVLVTIFFKTIHQFEASPWLQKV